MYDAGFWKSVHAIHSSCSHIQIRVGLDIENLDRNPHYTAGLYAVLNQNLNFDFSFYDIHDMEHADLIILKGNFVIQYALLTPRGFTMCTYIDDPASVQDIYEKFSLENAGRTEIITNVKSLWMVDQGYRTSFYTAGDFFFFLTNGIEYLLPHEVFDSILKKASPEQVPSVERLCITWEEILNKAGMDIMVPTSSLMRYLESGYIDLTEVEYKLSPQERKAHIFHVLAALQKNPRLSVGMISVSSNTTAFQEANLSFYSNYKTSFFKKNPQYIQRDTNSFYVILNKRLNAVILNFFRHLKDLPQHHHYEEPELTEKYTLYKPLIEKILSLSK